MRKKNEKNQRIKLCVHWTGLTLNVDFTIIIGQNNANVSFRVCDECRNCCSRDDESKIINGQCDEI